MNRPLPAVLLLSILLVACNGVTPPPAPAPGPGPANTRGPGSTAQDPGPPSVRTEHPRLVFTEDGHHYGEMEKHTQKSHTAVFYNGGSKPLEIRQVKTHCGCAAALLSAKTLPPGGRGTMKITMDSGGLPGRRTKTVEIFTNDPTTPVTKYAISCDIVADCGLDPIVMVIRATRATGDITAHFDVILLRPGFDLQITRVETSDPGLVAKATPLPKGGSKTGYRVNLKFGPSFASGDFKVRVTVHTNSKRDPTLVMDIFGSVRQAILVVPERLYYPRLKPGETVTRLIYVYREDKKPLKITGVEDPSGMFEISTRQTDPSRWEVRLDIGGEAPQKTVRGSVVIHTDEKSEPRVALPYEIPGEED